MLNLNEKQERVVESLKSLDPENEFFWDEKNKFPRFVKGKLSTPSHDNPELIARRFLKETRDLLDMRRDLDEQLEVSTQKTDNMGFHHVSFHQILNGFPVFEGSVQVHMNPEGEVIAYKDYRVNDLDISLEPKITKQAAVETVIKDIGSKVDVKKLTQSYHFIGTKKNNSISHGKLNYSELVSMVLDIILLMLTMASYCINLPKFAICYPEKHILHTTRMFYQENCYLRAE